MDKEELMKMAQEAGFMLNESNTAVNALGKSVPIAWIESIAEAIRAMKG